MKLKHIAICILWIGIASCNKYVDDFKTKGSLTATGVVSYRDLLNNTTIFEQTASLPDISADDLNYADQTQITSLQASTQYPQVATAYTWSDQYYLAGNYDADWNRLYNLILNCNTVLTEVPPLQADKAVKDEVMAEALVHRADAYFQLVSMYGKTYTKATATTDLGVPILIKVSVDQQLYRNTVQEVYDQIVKDLTDALPILPATNTFNTLPSQAAVYALLARVYLNIGDYGQAQVNAQKALTIKSTLIDLNKYITATYVNRINNPEIIFSKTAQTRFSSKPYILRFSDGLLNLLGTKDLRYQVFTRPANFIDASYTGRVFWKEIMTGDNRNTGPTVPEMMLINAECAARMGDAPTAINTLNQLRQTRFTPADYVPYSVTTVDAALSLVIDERRRELFFHGSRWFDQKRLNNESKFAMSITRTYLGATYTLDPGSNRYYYPIASQYFLINPYLIQNPR